MNLTTRRDFLCGLLSTSLSLVASANELPTQPRVLRQQIAGEWCVVQIPEKRERGEAVLILHGAGEWVNATMSSWEAQPGASRLVQALVDAGYIVGQSNAAARNGNGMWGNGETQNTTSAFAEWITRRYHLRRIHALAVSAGNLVLLNLLLGGQMQFDSAVMLAPCLSIASEYRCPGGINRVKTIAEAYRFAPASACPGDPQHDQAFVAATETADPMRRLEKLSDAQVLSIFGKTHLLAIYESGDPRVPPAENILAFSQRLQRAGVPLNLIRMEADTHGSQELFLRYTPQIVTFL
jgi:alpha-beta hydrolase superfamily lysophospholipase